MPLENIVVRESNKKVSEIFPEEKKELKEIEKKTLISQINAVIESNVLLFSSKGKAEVITDYVINKNYKTWKNPEIEKAIATIVLFNPMLSKILDGYIPNEIKENEKKEQYIKYGFNLEQVKSAPFERSSNWVTLCSKTAQKNALDFWIVLERGNAYDASPRANSRYTEGVDSLSITNMWQKYETKRANNSWKDIPSETLKQQSPERNFAELYTSSKSSYGHRSVAFRAKDGKWYVLDPYTFGNKDINPKPLDGYLTRVTIKKARLYKAQKYKTYSLNLNQN